MQRQMKDSIATYKDTITTSSVASATVFSVSKTYDILLVTVAFLSRRRFITFFLRKAIKGLGETHVYMYSFSFAENDALSTD